MAESKFPEQAAVPVAAVEVARPAEGTGASIVVREHSHGGQQPAETKAHRLASYDVADFPVPTGREEEWRFTPLARLRGLHDGSASADGSVAVEVDAPQPVTVETVGRDDARVGSVAKPTDRVAAQAYCAFEKATVITVPREARLDRPVTVRLRGMGGTAFGHLLVDVKELAEAVVIIDCSGSATYADNVEFAVGPGARLTVVTLQEWADDAVHLSHHQVRVGRDARFKSVLVTFGGDLVRTFPQVAFDGPGADAELLGLYFADAGQHLEQRLFVDHSAPHCRSRVTYKGALQGDGAHAVWVSDVLIRHNAEGTDTYELNRNLVLTDGARADSVPNLEIETGEVVGAGHASATGRFDDEQLFYLMSRGIPADEARRLVVRGFFAEVIHQIGIPEIEERLLAEVEAQLGRTLGATYADEGGGA
ncbi:Fe-S cluster assembly protein SufD [Carbonactinospora thermoautotrophica]|uniref:Fe-S cluster assembly protein SufD n=1 Tax=Carbonactinospora thermoautotrophica TaxID=1469144 RepID=UPI00099E6DDE|nr:Fe-S cluster assembly protein SufD [Carbonactinospora thermoautotrophica]